MAHSQPFTTLVYQHHSSSDLTGSPAGDGRQYTTYQWRGPRMLSLDTSPTPRQGPQDFFSSGSTGLAPSAFPNTFPADSQGFVFQLSNNGLPPGESRQIDNTASARRPFIRRRSARLHERQIRDESHSLALASDTARYDLRSTRPRAGDQFIPGQHATLDPIREYDNYPSSQFSSPASPVSPPELQWHNFQTAVSPAESVQRAASPTSSTASAMDLGNGNAPFQHILPPRPKKRRVSNRDKRDICEFHDAHPEMRQQDIAERWLIERSTVSKILKNKDRWLSIDPGERRTIYRLKDTKFPQVESELQKWLKECNDNGISVTDAEIKEKAKSIVPSLVVSGAFKASAGWLDNFKQRNGISHGRRTWEGTAYLDRRATGADYMVRNTEPEMDTSGTLPTDILQPHPTQEETPSSQSTPTIEEMATPMVAADADIAMHEEHGTYVDAGVIAATSGTTPPPLVGSNLSSPAAQDAVMQEAVISQSTAIGVGGVENGVGDEVVTTEDQPFTHIQDEAYDVPLNRSPTPPPAPRERPGLIDGSLEVEDYIDAVIVWFDQNPGFLQSLERDWIGRFKHIMLCYNTTGSIDRQRYAYLG